MRLAAGSPYTFHHMIRSQENDEEEEGIMMVMMPSLAFSLLDVLIGWNNCTNCALFMCLVIHSFFHCFRCTSDLDRNHEFLFYILFASFISFLSFHISHIHIYAAASSEPSTTTYLVIAECCWCFYWWLNDEGDTKPSGMSREKELPIRAHFLLPPCISTSSLPSLSKLYPNFSVHSCILFSWRFIQY